MQGISSGTQLTRNLVELIQVYRVDRIQVYHIDRISTFRDAAESSFDGFAWHFGDESIQIDQSFFDLNRLLRYRVAEKTLTLFF